MYTAGDGSINSIHREHSSSTFVEKATREDSTDNRNSISGGHSSRASVKNTTRCNSTLLHESSQREHSLTTFVEDAARDNTTCRGQLSRGINIENVRREHYSRNPTHQEDLSRALIEHTNRAHESSTRIEQTNRVHESSIVVESTSSKLMTRLSRKIKHTYHIKAFTESLTINNGRA